MLLHKDTAHKINPTQGLKALITRCRSITLLYIFVHIITTRTYFLQLSFPIFPSNFLSYFALFSFLLFPLLIFECTFFVPYSAIPLEWDVHLLFLLLHQRGIIHNIIHYNFTDVFHVRSGLALFVIVFKFVTLFEHLITNLLVSLLKWFLLFMSSSSLDWLYLLI